MKDCNCRFCGSTINHTFVDLGLSPLANDYLMEQNPKNGQLYFPLVVKVCPKCFLVQTMVYKRPEDIFSDYKYFSSFSTGWLEHSKAYVEMIVPKLNLNQSSCVAEIACNDGYLLQYFKPYGIPSYGVEPAENVAAKAREKGISVEVDFFNKKLAQKLAQRGKKADLVIGNNVLAHVPDINSFVEGLRIILASQGTITMEFPHLLNLIKYNQFDTIYHEHFSYLSLMTVQRIFAAHGLKIVQAEELSTHGGSLRIYATHQANDKIAPDESIDRILYDEKTMALDKIETYTAFNQKVKHIKWESTQLIADLKRQNKKIIAFGAAAKGNTFLNYCGIGRESIDYVVDSSPHKQGFFLPGTLIPILGKEQIAKTTPDYIIILPWNLRNEIQQELKNMHQESAKLITFIPDIEIF